MSRPILVLPFLLLLACGEGTVSTDETPGASTQTSTTLTGAGPIAGFIDSATWSNNQLVVSGWACDQGVASSIDVHVYVGGAAGVGTILGGFRAGVMREAAVSTACRTTGVAHGFRIALARSLLVTHAGKALYIHGISLSGGANNLINNSGLFRVPSSPVLVAGWEGHSAISVTNTYGRYLAEAFADSGPMNTSRCPGGLAANAPLAIMYQGGDGKWPRYSGGSDDGLFATADKLRAAFRRVCVRMVMVGGVTTYWANAPARAATQTIEQFSRQWLGFAAVNVRTGINRLLVTNYPGAPKYFYLGGSMSSMVGAAMINNGWDGASTLAAYSKLTRAFMSGPPAGNVYRACRNSAPGFFLGFADAPCSSFTNEAQAYLFSPSGHLQQFVAQRYLTTFVGSNDALFGWPAPGAWTGAQGVADFAVTAGLSCTSADCTDNPSAIGSRAVTFREIAGATHSNTWDYMPVEMCRRMAWDLLPGTTQAQRDAVCNGASL